MKSLIRELSMMGTSPFLSQEAPPTPATPLQSAEETRQSNGSGFPLIAALAIVAIAGTELFGITNIFGIHGKKGK